jgi:hypothetical protein
VSVLELYGVEEPSQLLEAIGLKRTDQGGDVRSSLSLLGGCTLLKPTKLSVI